MSNKELLNNDGLKEWEAKLLDNENQPKYYDPLELLALRDNINVVAKVAVIVYALIGIFNIPLISWLIRGKSFTLSDVRFVPDILMIVLNTGLGIAITYFPLIALTHILRILMEMEFNSRKAN